MIPPLRRDGRLPPGVYDSTWKEVVALFGISEHRLRLIAGLKEGLDMLKKAGCAVTYVDGSFVTSKELPGDFDVCWQTKGVDAALLDPIFLDFSNRRQA
jgi:hypothetical protein